MHLPGEREVSKNESETCDETNWSNQRQFLCTSVKATDVLGVQKRVWNMRWDRSHRYRFTVFATRSRMCDKTDRDCRTVHSFQNQPTPCIISNLEAVLFPEIWVTVVRLSGPILFPDAFGWWFANPFRSYFSNASRCGALTESSTR